MSPSMWETTDVSKWTNELQVPHTWVAGEKENLTLYVSRTLSARVDELSKQLNMTKSFLFLLGMALVLKWLDEQEGT